MPPVRTPTVATAATVMRAIRATTARRTWTTAGRVSGSRACGVWVAVGQGAGWGPMRGQLWPCLGARPGHAAGGAGGSLTWTGQGGPGWPQKRPEPDGRHFPVGSGPAQRALVGPCCDPLRSRLSAPDPGSEDTDPRNQASCLVPPSKRGGCDPAAWGERARAPSFGPQ